MILLLKKIKRYLIHLKRIKLWRRNNTHNGTTLGDFYFNNLFDMSLVEVGKETFGPINVISSNVGERLRIGSYCSIAPNVVFILNSEHNLNTVSSFPFKVKISKVTQYEGKSKGNIIVEDDVWLGYNSTILSGVHIHQGAVVAAGSVVTKDVPPYAIVGGSPARVIRYRFNSKIVNELSTIDYSKLTEQLIRDHITDLYTEVTDIEQLKWMPKK